MRINKIAFLLLAFAFLPSSSWAKDKEEKTVVTIDGKAVSSGEFLRMYRKSGEPGKPQDIDAYLQQFIIFKLKVADAMHQGTDTTSSFIKELNGYREQLAAAYLTDPTVKEQTLHDAYSRYLKEVHASHILTIIPEKGSPADTLKAWEKAMKARNELIAGSAFEAVAKKYSEDPSASINGGDLGYFTVFQMIAPFEDAAYTLPAGEVSMPVRTKFGYHIIKVWDRRPSNGKVRVAHIMKAVPPGSPEELAVKAEKGINDIYRQLQEGVSFKILASGNSDHRESAEKGGELNWFGAGEILPQFAEAAFALKDTGTFTKPVRTPYGWHIIRLLEKKAPGTFDEVRAYLESRIDQNKLFSDGKKAFTAKLIKEYDLRVSDKILGWFLAKTDTAVIKGSAKFDRKTLPSGNIYTFGKNNLSALSFAGWLESKSSASVTDDPAAYVRHQLDSKITDDLISYENSILEQKYSEFRYLMSEFHDGMLLFDISQKNVWNKASSDSAGLKEFFMTNITDFPAAEGKTENLDAIKGEVMAKYQEYLENTWVRQLKDKYAVKINEEEFRKIRNEKSDK